MPLPQLIASVRPSCISCSPNAVCCLSVVIKVPCGVHLLTIRYAVCHMLRHCSQPSAESQRIERRAQLNDCINGRCSESKHIKLEAQLSDSPTASVKRSHLTQYTSHRSVDACGRSPRFALYCSLTDCSCLFMQPPPTANAPLNLLPCQCLTQRPIVWSR